MKEKTPTPESPPCEECEHLERGEIDVKKGKSVTVFRCKKYEKKTSCPKYRDFKD